MSQEVRFRMSQCQSFPSGMGSYYFKGSYEIIVKNLAYEKKVSIWKGTGGHPWDDLYANYEESLPGNLEMWRNDLPPNGDFNFDAKYVVNGNTYWDNNNGSNYQAYAAGDEFIVVTGSDFPVVHGCSELFNHKLTVYAGVQNRSFEKIIGLRYTTDDWASWTDIYAGYLWTMRSGLEVWKFEKDLPGVSNVKFALFYHGQGWDNNFTRNYSVSLVMPMSHIKSKDIKFSESTERSKWDIPLSKVALKEIKADTKIEKKIKEEERELEPA